MPSQNKTPLLGLNQWQGNEYPKREDFNNDNLVIDKKIDELVNRPTAFTGTFRNTVLLKTNSSNIKFFGNEIVAFNKSSDALFVWVNSTYIEKGQDYNINADSMSIDKINGTWDGTLTPVTFNFVIFKNVTSSITLADGSLLQPKSLTLDKLTSDIQDKINKVGNTTLSTKAQDLSAAVNETLNIVDAHLADNVKRQKRLQLGVRI